LERARFLDPFSFIFLGTRSEYADAPLHWQPGPFPVPQLPLPSLVNQRFVPLWVWPLRLFLGRPGYSWAGFLMGFIELHFSFFGRGVNDRGFFRPKLLPIQPTPHAFSLCFDSSRVPDCSLYPPNQPSHTLSAPSAVCLRIPLVEFGLAVWGFFFNTPPNFLSESPLAPRSSPTEVYFFPCSWAQ